MSNLFYSFCGIVLCALEYPSQVWSRWIARRKLTPVPLVDDLAKQRASGKSKPN